MRRIINYMAFAAVLLPALVACSSKEDMPKASDVPVAVYLSRAEGTAAQNDEVDYSNQYAIVFWEHDTGEDNAWAEIISGVTVDEYNYAKQRFFNVHRNNESVYYPETGELKAIGYYPANALIPSEDYDLLTLNEDIYKPGFVDICTTQKITGTAADPFTAGEGEKELRYEHTQVRVNFKVQETEDVKGRLTDVVVKIPQLEMATQWKYNYDEGVEKYEPLENEALKGTYVTLYSDTEWIIAGETVDLYDGAKRPDGIVVVDKNRKYCYLNPDAELFKDMDESVQTKMRVELEAKIIDSEGTVPNRHLEGRVDIPLTHEDGSPFMGSVHPGDAFEILIIFKQNKIDLLAQKCDWEDGPVIVVPLDPQ